MPKNDVAVVGIGQTKFRSKRRDVNIPEMIYEAVKMALDDAKKAFALKPDNKSYGQFIKDIESKMQDKPSAKP